MYTQDYDENMPPWTANARGAYPGGAFGLQHMYPSLVGPYIKNGVEVLNPATGAGNLGQVWACPSSKGSLSPNSNTYAYNYYGLGGTHNCSGGPLGAAYAPFNSAEYTKAAALASLGRPAETIMLTDGGQLSRPPAAYAANGNSANNN